MTVYHKSKELIIVHHLRPSKETGHTIRLQTSLINMLGGGLKTIYDAHEIWFYNSVTHIFTAYKNESGISSLLKSFLADKGINVKPDAISIRTAQPTQYRFANDKDLFHFNLKFGN